MLGFRYKYVRVLTYVSVLEYVLAQSLGLHMMGGTTQPFTKGHVSSLFPLYICVCVCVSWWGMTHSSVWLLLYIAPSNSKGDSGDDHVPDIYMCACIFSAIIEVVLPYITLS